MSIVAFSMMSATAWQSLTSLPMADSADQILLSRDLRLNGFTLCREGLGRYKMAAVTDVIPCYGTLSDLEDILCHTASGGADCYRPNKVCHYIQVGNGISAWLLLRCKPQATMQCPMLVPSAFSDISNYALCIVAHWTHTSPTQVPYSANC